MTSYHGKSVQWTNKASSCLKSSLGSMLNRIMKPELVLTKYLFFFKIEYCCSVPNSSQAVICTLHLKGVTTQPLKCKK